jgi:mono/diheme cytochrome c family protein
MRNTYKVIHRHPKPLTPETLEDQLEDQLDDLRLPLRRLVITLLAFTLIIGLSIAGFRYVQASDPYIREVLALDGLSPRGEAIFKMNCAVCHGIQATGEVGPNLVGIADHRTKVSLIQQVTSGRTPPMPQFQPDPQSMADLLAYLERL